MRTHLEKLRMKKSGRALVLLTERLQLIWRRFQFLVPNIGQVNRRTAQSFRNGAATSQGGGSEDDVSQALPKGPQLGSDEPRLVSMSKGAKAKGTETLDKECQTSKVHQEKL
ncbi:hypothetical protein DPMN_138000 [Dreissena polymorpha]|uniref:Uncharacterized protein n=1 Tax=Dreissena polymorpha TaxID=45954 RepID=A0A9D4G6T5_DREPO|nr:hypothetical protein DPMN_138000 [Dreissena polymorpha]